MKKIKLFNKHGVVYKLVKDISHALFIDGLCCVYLIDGTDYNCSLCLADIIKLYKGFGLHLIHQSILINVNKVRKSIPYNRLMVTMIDGSEHWVSYRKKREFLALKIMKWIDLGQ